MNGPVICKWKHSAQVWGSQTNQFHQIYKDKNELNMSTWVSVVGFLNGNEQLQNRFVLKSFLGHNVGYYGYFQIEALEDESNQGIFDECYGIEVNPDQVWDENSQPAENSSKLLKRVKTSS